MNVHYIDYMNAKADGNYGKASLHHQLYINEEIRNGRMVAPAKQEQNPVALLVGFALLAVVVGLVTIGLIQALLR